MFSIKCYSLCYTHFTQTNIPTIVDIIAKIFPSLAPFYMLLVMSWRTSNDCPNCWLATTLSNNPRFNWNKADLLWKMMVSASLDFPFLCENTAVSLGRRKLSPSTTIFLKWRKWLYSLHCVSNIFLEMNLRSC